jgi:uncharacterized protein YegP (UPF0339 family)
MIEVYQDRHGWYWQMRASNNEIVAVSGEFYATATEAEMVARRMRLDGGAP